MAQEQLSTLQKLIDAAIEFCVKYSFQVLGALIVIICGFIIAKSAAKMFMGFAAKKEWDITLSKFLAGCIRIMILGFAAIIAMGNFGITIAPFVAALGALAFGTSFAIQGPLSNYGAGLSLIMTRPFRVGNTISVAEVSGVVEDIKLACTILTTEDGVCITIPNRQIVGEILHNSFENRIVEGVVGISYDNDPEVAIRAVRETLDKFPEVRQDPKPQIGIQAFADSSVNIGFRYWVPTIKYFHLSYAINLAVYKAIQQAGIKIPYPQRDVRIISQPANA